ncbi:PE-PPE domain-containing protein [Mycolicibacterium palauense]|uniref:PE-PPE domain-containing protein n=1 Tax=Mycolicibacterium palauense TaxID=2034511 RepID=UPI00159BC300|nr:PE-PPE domain-containing protein [Mycolicibacterium palauense]
MHTVRRAASALVLGLAIALAPTAQAQTMLVAGGAIYYFFPGITAEIGRGFYPEADRTLIEYPASPGLLIDRSLRVGVDRLDAAIRSTAAPLVVSGLSEGSIVIDHELARLADDPAAPPSDQLAFVLIASPERGLMSLLRQGVHIPIVDYTVAKPVESQYDTVIVRGEYDGWADPPDRPWNLLATLNAVMGAAIVHSAYAGVDPATIPPEDVTTTVNSKGATVTTYLRPTEHLPLTLAARLFVPGAIVDRIDARLRPIIDAGYVRHDRPGDRRPYLSDGRIRFPAPPTVTESHDRTPKTMSSRRPAVPVTAPSQSSAATAEAETGGGSVHDGDSPAVTRKQRRATRRETRLHTRSETRTETRPDTLDGRRHGRAADRTERAAGSDKARPDRVQSRSVRRAAG